MVFGPQIRAALSPEVRYAYPEMRDIGGRYRNAIPASAVWTGEDSGAYVWKITRSDEYPEPAYVVNACPINIETEAEGTVIFGFDVIGLSSSDAVAVAWKAELKDGMCVRPVR